MGGQATLPGNGMIGILGGTFDPIHNAHLRSALEVQQALGLEQLRLIPLRDPPHRGRPHSSPALRLEMVRAAAGGLPGFMVDARELERTRKSYSIDTLRSLRRELGETRPLCLLMGSDAFRHFPDWHRPEEILRLAHLVVMQRPGEGHPAHYAEHATDRPERLRTRPGGCILFQPVTQMAISSSAIRTLIRRGESPRFLLPDPVLTIIRRQNLYGGD
ncbi:MAG: nicotinate-nucleotide adenylyltransferase [Candidatus Sedimenticola endophacoides]